MNTFEVIYSLDRRDSGGNVEIRHGFCIMSNAFLAKFRKTIDKKTAKGEDWIKIDVSTPDPNVTFFSEHGVKTINSKCLSEWPIGQEPLNMAHWNAVIIVTPGENGWRVVNSGPNV